MPRHGQGPLLRGHIGRHVADQRPVAGGLLQHSTDPCTDRGIKAATGPGLARHQTTPVLRRMWLAAEDRPARL